MIEKLKDILKREYGIETDEQLIEAFKKCQGIDIGIFVKKENEGRNTNG